MAGWVLYKKEILEIIIVDLQLEQEEVSFIKEVRALGLLAVLK